VARTVRTCVQRHLGRLYGTRNRNLPRATGKTAAKGATAASPTAPFERDANPVARVPHVRYPKNHASSRSPTAHAQSAREESPTAPVAQDHLSAQCTSDTIGCAHPLHHGAITGTLETDPETDTEGDNRARLQPP
jgi:hypothetical protein